MSPGGYQPVRRRERYLQQGTSADFAQRFVNIQSAGYDTFTIQRLLFGSPPIKRLRALAFKVWAFKQWESTSGNLKRFRCGPLRSPPNNATMPMESSFKEGHQLGRTELE